jgi:hypothetical protein
MGLFDKIFGKQQAPAAAPPPEHSILIYLKGEGLDEAVYRSCDTVTLDGLLTKAMGAHGVVSSIESRSTETILFLYGADSEKMFSLIDPVLNSYPLCKSAKVVLRTGPSGSPEREITI